MLNFVVLYISGKQDADLGNRLGSTIPSKGDKERISQGGSMGRNRLLPRKPIAVRVEGKDAMEWPKDIYIKGF